MLWNGCPGAGRYAFCKLFTVWPNTLTVTTDWPVFLAEKGILVVGNDHLGHGKSIYNKGDEKHTGSSHPYGYFCSQDPATTAVKDVHRLKKMIQEENPGVPYLMLGHSMGSFILRNYLCAYGTGIDGANHQGTGMQPGPCWAFPKSW